MTCFTGTKREIDLVDIIFSCVSTVLDPRHHATFMTKSQEEKMQWVTDQLKGCGFPTMPVGSCWGRIIDPALVPADLKDEVMIVKPKRGD